MKLLGKAIATLSAFFIVHAPIAWAMEGRGDGDIDDLIEIGHEETFEHPIDADAAQEAAHLSGHGAEGSAGLPQFDPSSFPSQIFWLAVGFIFLYVFFSKRTLPEISSVIESRHQHIQSDLDTAEKLKEEAEQVHQVYEQALEKARAQATEYYLQADRDIKDKTSAAMRAFYDRSVEQVAGTEKTIEKAKAAAMEDMSSVAAEIAASAAQKIVGVSTDIDEAKSLVQSIHKRKAA